MCSTYPAIKKAQNPKFRRNNPKMAGRLPYGTATEGTCQWTSIHPYEGNTRCLAGFYYRPAHANNMKKCEFSLYADDTLLFTNCKSVDKAQKLMQASLLALAHWCHKNAIFVNVKKTKHMLFGTRVALAKYRDKIITLKITSRQFRESTAAATLELLWTNN